MGDGDAPDYASVVEFAGALADAARPVALRHFRTTLQVETKSDASPVTVADREIEAKMRARIESRFPGHGIFGEELGWSAARNSCTWVIDPIDGTKSFISGMPTFGTLIAFCVDKVPEVGVIDMPGVPRSDPAIIRSTATSAKRLHIRKGARA